MTPGIEDNLLFSMNIATPILFLTSLAIFVVLAAKTRNIRTFQFQISVFIAIYTVGQIIENYKIGVFAALPTDIGSQIHVVSTLLLTMILWVRFYSSERVGKNLVENPDNTSYSSSS